MDTFRIKSSTLELTFDTEFGNLVGMIAPDVDWNVFDRPHLGRNWELMIPLPGRRNNPVYGYKHKLAALEVTGETKAVMRWSGLTSEHGGTHDVAVDITVEAIDEAIIWRTVITNNGGEGTVVENVCSPIIADIRRPKGAEYVLGFYDGYGGPNETCIYPIFHNFKGYWGVDGPTQIVEGGVTHGAPYYLLRPDSGIGLYFAPYEPVTQLMSWRVRLFPGPLMSSIMSVPDEDFISGKEVHRTFDIVHVPFIYNGETTEITPIQLQAYRGDWSVGTNIYKENRDKKWNWDKPVYPEWARNPHSWLQIQMNSPEDELRWRFTDLPNVAEECARYGITAIQLVGWNHGGQDQFNPSHDPDPRLGTYQELKDAIAQCHQMGVKIILFSKFVWADISTEWYRKELYQYAIRDPHGDTYRHGGYQYQTVSQLLDVNTKRFAPLCFLSEECRKILVNEFKKVVDLGAAGMLYDESMTHGGANLCFADNHGHRVGEYTYNKDRELMQAFREVCPPDFLFCGEGCHDMQMQDFHVSYYRMPCRDTINLKKFIRPKGALHMIAVTGFNDRDVINVCLLNNYIVSYEPYYFKGRPSDFPLTMEYGMQMQELREEVKQYVWDGEYLCKNGAQVFDAEGNAHKYYTVFRADNGKLGVVVVNYNDTPLRVKIELEAGQISRWKAVGGEWKTGEIILPPSTAVVAIQE